MSRKLDKTNRFKWYHTGHANDQARMWRFFIIKKDISVDSMTRCLDKYLITNPVGMREKRYVLDSFYCNFDRLLKIVTEETGVSFGSKKY